MTEEQLEIETQGCERCGKELPDMHLGELCSSCERTIEEARTKLDMTQKVISKLISGEVSKADLNLFNKIIIFSASLDPFASFEINQSEMAKRHFLQQANISRSIKKLLASGLLVKNENLYSLGISKITYSY